MLKLSEKRLRSWRKRLPYAALLLAGLLFGAWRVVIWYTERTTPFSGAPQPTCSTLVLANRYAQAADEARAQLQALLAERSIPGLTAAVAVNGAIVWSEGFGYADREKRLPACPQTRLRIHSLAKTITAMGLALLYEQRRLDLDAPIQQYVPGFPDKGYKLTAGQLASHRGGVRAYHDDYEALNTRHYRSVSESLEVFKNDPLLFAPGSGFEYSGYGYVLLSAAIEGAASEDFLSYVRKHICAPLQMHSTTEIRAHEELPNQSRFYDNVTPYSPDGQVREAPFIDFSSKWAAGGFLSTAEDLVRFGSAHIAAINKGFLQAETLELFFTPRTQQMGVMGYGLGWITARDLRLRRAHLNFGAGSGGTSVLAIFPAQKLSVALLANLGHARFPFARLMGVVNPFLAAAD